LGGRLFLKCRPPPDDMTQIYKKKFKGPIFTNHWSKWPRFTKKTYKILQDIKANSGGEKTINTKIQQHYHPKGDT